MQKVRWNWGPSCGFEDFEIKMIFVKAQQCTATTPISRLLAGCRGFANPSPFSSSSSLSEVLPFAALYFLFSDRVFWLPEQHLFPKLLISAIALLSPEPKPGLYSFTIFKSFLYSPSIFNRVKWYLGLSETIHLLFKKLPSRPSAFHFELEVHSPSFPRLAHNPGCLAN